MEARDNPSTPSLEYQRLSPRWQLWDDLSSTETMRAARTKHLPQDPREELEVYEARLKGSFLYPAARKTHADLVAKPFSKPVKLAGADELAEAISDDADRCGCDLSKFAEAIYGDAVARSRSFIVVDYPNTGGAQNHGQERSGEVRPYLVHIPAQRMLSFRTERMENGDTIVTEARWLETLTERDGFSENERERVRQWAIEDGQKVWRTWIKVENEADEWALEADGSMELAGDGLPVVQLCVDEDPPLHSLAELNVEHWRVKSDRSNVLHIQGCPLLVGTGIESSQVRGGRVEEVQFAVGPRQSYTTPISEARVYYAEVSGAAAAALKDALDDIRAEMEVLGLQPFLRQGSAAATATQERNDANRADSMAQQWVRATEAAILNAFRFAYAWAKRKMPKGLAVNIYSDFQLDALADAHIKVLFDAHARGLLTKLDLAQEIARRGITAESYDPEESIELAEGEMQMALPMSEPPSEEDEPDDDEGEEDAA